MIKVLLAKIKRLKIIFPYYPVIIGRVKTIQGNYWTADKKQWRIPDSKDVLSKISKIFSDEKSYIDPALQTEFSDTIPFRETPGETAKQINKAQIVKSNLTEGIPIIDNVCNLIILKHYLNRARKDLASNNGRVYLPFAKGVEHE
jgi:hypothetical protein